VYGYKQVQILDMLADGSPTFDPEGYELDKENFEAILDIQILSFEKEALHLDIKLSDLSRKYLAVDLEFKIVVACLCTRNKTVNIFDIKEPWKNKTRCIYFKNEISLDNMKAKISKDYSNAVVSNMNETYLLKHP